MATYVPNGRQQFCDGNGKPLAAGSVGMYVTGTLTPKNTWQDADETTLNSNPIPLDSGGFANIYGSGEYRQIVKDSLGNTIYDQVISDMLAPLEGSTGYSIIGGLPILTPAEFYEPTDPDYGTALNRMYANLRDTGINPANSGIYVANRKVIIPAGNYTSIAPVDIEVNVETEGEGGMGFGAGGGAATQITFSSGISGFRVQAYDTANDTDVVANHQSGAYSTFRNLYVCGPAAANGGLLSGTGLLEGEHHGFEIKAIVYMDGVQIEGFQGDALYEHTTIGGGSPIEGQSSLSRFYNCVFRNSRNGVSIAGGDSNAQVFTACQFLYNRACGVDDGSFLSNSYIHPHASGNGISHDNDGSSNFPAYVVSYNGNRYCAIQGQETGASTNAPSGTTADNTWWYYLSAGGAIAGIPAWTSGISVRCGAPYRTSNINAPNHFYNPYSEGGQGFSQFKAPTVCHGGLHGSGGPKGTGVLVQNIGGAYVVNDRIGSFDTAGHGALLGNPATSAFYQQFSDGTNNMTLTPFSGDIAMTHANSSTQTDWFYALLGEGTSNPVGKRRIGFPNGFGVASKKWFPGTAAPVTGAYNVGDMVWNTAPAASGNIGWVCTTAGSPGTWKTFGSIGA